MTEYEFSCTSYDVIVGISPSKGVRPFNCIRTIPRKEQKIPFHYPPEITFLLTLFLFKAKYILHPWSKARATALIKQAKSLRSTKSESAPEKAVANLNIPLFFLSKEYFYTFK